MRDIKKNLLDSTSKAQRMAKLSPHFPRRWLIVSQNYVPEPGAASVRLSKLANILQEFGMHVEVFTAMPNYPLGIIPEKYRAKWSDKEVIEGIQVHRSWVYGYGGNNKFKRILNFISFTFSSVFNLFRLKRPDVLFIESFPIPIGLLGLLSKWFWRVPYVYNVPDLQIDGAFEMGWAKDGFFLRTAARFENFVMKQSWLISTVTNRCINYLHTKCGIDRKKITFLPNGVDTTQIKPVETDLNLIKEYGLENKKVFMYAGTLHRTHRAEVIIEAAELLKQRDDIRIFFLGGGVTRQDLIDMAEQKGLHNIIFGLSSYTNDQLPAYMSIVRSALVTLSDTPIHKVHRPAKTFPPLACGKPVIFSGDCEAADLLVENDCGLAVTPEDPQALADAIVRLADDEKEAIRLGQSGLKFIQSEMTWEGIIQRWFDELDRFKTQTEPLKPLRVLILDGFARQSLPFMRAMRHSGHHVTVACPSRMSMGYLCRYPNRRLIWPDYDKNPEAFAEKMLGYAKEYRPDVTMALCDTGVDILSHHKQEMLKYTGVPVPDYDIFMKAADKAQTMAFCMENSIPCPTTYFPDKESLESIISKVTFPIIIKPRRGIGAMGLHRLQIPQELLCHYDKLRSDYGDLIIQEYIPIEGGTQFQAEAFLDENSKMRVCMTIAKPRFFPVTGGTSSANVTIDHQEIRESTRRLLEGIGWIGAADVDFILDPRDNVPKILEINPRVTAGIKIGFAAGIDYADLQMRLALKMEIPEIKDYKLNVVLRNLCLDILWYKYANKIQRKSTLPKWWNFFGKNVHYQTFGLYDPLPLLGFIWTNLGKYIDSKAWKAKLAKDL